MPSDDPPKAYTRKRLSEYEGFKRIDKNLEKFELEDRSKEKVCDVCGRRCRAWRIVPAAAGARLGVTKASMSGGLTGKFLVCCDKDEYGCASVLTRSGVPEDAIREQALADRLGLIIR